LLSLTLITYPRVLAPQVRGTYALPGTEHLANYSAASSTNSSRSTTPSTLLSFPARLSTPVPQRQLSAMAPFTTNVPSTSNDSLHRRTLLRNMAVGSGDGNMDWGGPDFDINMDDSRQEGDLSGDNAGFGRERIEGGDSEEDIPSDDGSQDSWTAALGQLEDQTGKGKVKRGKAKAKVKAKAKAKKAKGKELEESGNEYQRSREKNIARNELLLKNLGLDQAATDLGFARPKPTPRVRGKDPLAALPARRSTRTG
jgi:hypothetical protein